MIQNPKLTLALVQTDLYWKDKVANLAMLEEKLWQMEESVDLILLPEMFPTGFTMDAKEVAEPMNFHVCRWMKQLASQKKAVIAGSAVIQEGKDFFNRLLWVQPDGQILTYDKRHLFRMADEHHHFSAGKHLPIFEWMGWRICPQVCYDLRFPVWSRNFMTEKGMNYDLIFNVASWPAVRSSAWDTLLPARGIENLAYSVGLNRVGTDGNQIPYVGHSAVYDFKGESMLFMGEDEQVSIIELDKTPLECFRKKFPAWNDADQFKLI